MALVLLLAVLVSATAQFGWQQRDTVPTWTKYVKAPPSRTVSPTGIVADSVSGDVSNPNGLISKTGPTVLTRSNTSDAGIPSLTIDFGQNYAGQITINFAGASTSEGGGTSTVLPGLRLAFSETLEFLTTGNDYARSDRASGDQHVVFNETDQVCLPRHCLT
jgi:hypothetical protein